MVTLSLFTCKIPVHIIMLTYVLDKSANTQKEEPAETEPSKDE